MNERTKRRIIGVGGVALIAALSVTSARASAESPPARVSGASYVLDIVESLTRVAPGIANGLASSLLVSEPLPPPLDQAQHAVAQAGSDLAGQASTEGPENVQRARAAIAPLAVLNPGVNAGLSAVSSALDAAANPAIQPFDRTARELSEMVASAQEPPPERAP